MYVYDESSGTAKLFTGAWPGTFMTSEGSGWYTGSVNTTDKVKFIANNNNAGSQDPSGVGSSGYDVQGEVWIKNGTVTSAGKVYVRYVDTTNGVTLDSQTLTGMQGSAYTTSAKTFSGYTLSSTPTNASGQYGSSTIYVTYNYTSNNIPLSASASISEDSIDLGDSVTLSASASGGTTPYKYSYYSRPVGQTSWNTINANGGSSIVYTPTSAGDYQVKIVVTDSDSATVEKTLSLTVNGSSSDLVNTSSINSDKLTLGQRIYFSGSAEGGTAPYRYAYYYKRTSAKLWTTLGTEYGTSVSEGFSPKALGDFMIKISVKDSTGTVVDKDFTVTIVDGKSTAFKNNSTISTTGAKLGTKVKLVGAATGSSGYKYSFYYKRTTARLWYRIGSDFTSTSKAQFTPKAEGDFNVKIDIMDTNGEIVSRQFAVTISSDYDIATTTVNNSTISTNYAPVGTRIIVTAAATGGTKPYTYAFYYKRAAANQWKVIGTEYSTKATAGVTLKNAGDFIFKVCIRDANGGMVSKNLDVEMY